MYSGFYTAKNHANSNILNATSIKKDAVLATIPT